MQRSFQFVFIASLLLWPAGCMDDYVPAPLPPDAKEKEQASPEPSAETAPVDSQPTENETPKVETKQPTVQPEEKPIVTPQPVEIPQQKPSPPSAPAGPRIELDLGVALAQTGPEGTMMMFSVEYEFVSGKPDPKAKYYWVIERTKGASIKLERRLKQKHKLMQAISGWRPEQGPFRSHIEDGDGKRISDSIDMR